MMEISVGHFDANGKGKSTRGSSLEIFYSDKLSQWDRLKLWLFDPAF